MIGPHAGKELELMLAGQKHFAMFCEALIPGQDTPEEIIPEQAFAPYVRNGIFKRLCEDITSSKSPIPGRYVCFTSQGNEWRTQAFLWMHKECIAGRRPFDSAYEYFVGRLLDYKEEDIQHFINAACPHLKTLAA